MSVHMGKDYVRAYEDGQAFSSTLGERYRYDQKPRWPSPLPPPPLLPVPLGQPSVLSSMTVRTPSPSPARTPSPPPPPPQESARSQQVTDTTISQDATSGKRAQELALLEALGSKYQIEFSLPGPIESATKSIAELLMKMERKRSTLVTISPYSNHKRAQLKAPPVSYSQSQHAELQLGGKLDYGHKLNTPATPSTLDSCAEQNSHLYPSYKDGSYRASLTPASTIKSTEISHARERPPIENARSQALEYAGHNDNLRRADFPLEGDLYRHDRPQPDPGRYSRDSYPIPSSSNDSMSSFSRLKKNINPPSWERQGTSTSQHGDQDIEELQRNNLLLAEALLQLTQKVEKRQLPTWSVLHRVNCSSRKKLAITVDPPSTFGKTSHLEGNDPVPELDIFIAERKHNLAFIVFKNYTCCRDPGGDLYGEHDSVRIVSSRFAQLLTEVTARLDKSVGFFPNFLQGIEFAAPFFWYYHCIGEFAAQAAQSTTEAKNHLSLFQEYVESDFGHLYKAIQTQLGEGKISRENLPFLFCPGSVLSFSDKGAAMTGALKSWPDFQDFGSCMFSLWGWNFDGSFCKSSYTQSIGFKEAFKHCEEAELIRVTDLPCFPLQYASTDTRSRLRKRGEAFWRCRQKYFTTYNGWDYRHEEWNVDIRYMIDLATYYKMHPDKQPFRRLKDELGAEAMASDEPPGGDFVFLLPSIVRGFNLLEKKWVELDVGGISHIQWNKEAFNSLAIDQDTKLMISALVTNKIETEKSTDLIKGKGSGLMILLHGGPGTGKTLTAESVAEIAEKPLYRVTCGDIGTNPDSVEKYLSTVLLLGKTWDCVVLLDEADVFLEQRTLTDLQRNALVSVFLRVLEYYDGILILTSNRVGTFDEAFKSRIQLALHYEGLNEEQRRKIWGNFIRRLEKLDDNEKPIEGESSGRVVDTDDLRSHIHELAKFPLNGREIRNAVTTARQLALYKKKKMDYKDVVHVIGVIEKFNKYILNVNEGTTDEQIMREDHVR